MQSSDGREIEKRLSEFKTCLEASSLEIKTLSGDRRAEFKAIFKEHRTAYKEIRTEYDHLMNDVMQKELLAGAPADDVDDNNQSAYGLMEHALDVQDRGKQSIMRTLQTAADAKMVGIDVVTKLEANTERLSQMNENMDEIENTLARSTKIMRRMARKMMTDKYIWVVTLLVIGAIIALVVVKEVKKNGSVAATVCSVTSSVGAATGCVSSSTGAAISSSTGAATTSYRIDRYY